MKSGKQEQTGLSLIILHCELGPQGDGVHEGGASVAGGSGDTAEKKIKNYFTKKQ